MNLHDVLLASQIAQKNSGSTGDINLSDYYTKSQTDGLLSEFKNYDDTEIRSENALSLSTLGYQRKNLLKITVPPKNSNGITFSLSNGVLSLSGTATKTFDSYFPECTYSVTESDSWIHINEKSIISCYGSLNSLSLGYYKPDAEHVFENINFKTINNSSSFILEKGSIIIGLYIRLTDKVDYTGKDLSFMLRYADITDSSYESYKPSVLEYIEEFEKRIRILEERIT